MPPYRAQLGGIEGSGQYVTGSGAPDYAAMIQAIAGGASSLIHNAYLRKLANRQNAAATAQREFENKRQSEQDAREVAKAKADAEDRRQRLALDAEKLRIEKVKAGFTPAHEEAVPDTPAGPVQTIDLPVAAGQPAAPPLRLRTPAMRGGTVQMPEEYDPTKAEGYVKAIDTQALRTTAAEAARKANQDAAMERLERSAELTAQRQLDHDKRTGASKAGARGLTANALEAWRKSMADGIIQNLDGDLSAAENFLANDEKGRTYAVRGLTGEDLFAAAGRFRSQAARAATGILSSTSPERAVEKVGQVRRLMTPGGASKAGAKPDSTKAAPAAAPAPVTPPARAAAPPSAPPASGAKNTISKAEAEALKKLGWKDADITAKYTVTP